MEYKLNYARATDTAKRSWPAFLLWEFITPGYTAIWILLTSAWYYYRASNADTEGAKKAFNEVAVVFLVWGLVNISAYGVLVYMQRR